MPAIVVWWRHHESPCCSKAGFTASHHVAAQRVSGLTQAAYCREYRLNAKYFSRWKRVLSCAMRGAVATPDSPALIPVVLMRILKDLPREIRLIDIPGAEKVCACCGGALHCFGEESSEQLHYVPAMVRIVETRRRKYACDQCQGELKRAREDIMAPLPKSMASASLLAYPIVSKFADHCPLHRISQRLNRLGIEIGHGLMSEWLVDVAPLLEGVVERMANQVRDTGHVFTDDTILPLQNDDPERRSTINARLWVYASGLRRTKPLVVYDFSRGRSQDAPIEFLKDFRAHLQAVPFPVMTCCMAGTFRRWGVWRTHDESLSRSRRS